MKAGYYFDMFDDLVIVYPDSTYHVYNIYFEDFVLGTQDLKNGSGKFLVEYIGSL